MRLWKRAACAAALLACCFGGGALGSEADFAARVAPELVPAYQRLRPMKFAETGSEYARVSTRRLIGSARVPRDEAVVVRNVYIPNGDGTNLLRVRVYAPRGGEGPLPAILWMHGGGFLFGTPEQDEAQSIRFVKEVGAVVASVDYRLGPEHPYPAALRDCYAALAWLFREAEVLGVDTGRIAIAGGSAGGNLCAALALLARDRGEFALAFQMPLYPMLDDRVETPSSREETDLRVWSPQSNRYVWDVYSRGTDGTDAVPPYMAPARAEDLSGLPPAYLCVSTLDPFRDEVLAYAARLAAAGVPVECHLYPRAYHAFETLAPETDYSRRVVDEYVEVLRRALHAE